MLLLKFLHYKCQSQQQVNFFINSKLLLCHPSLQKLTKLAQYFPQSQDFKLNYLAVLMLLVDVKTLKLLKKLDLNEQILTILIKFKQLCLRKQSQSSLLVVVIRNPKTNYPFWQEKHLKKAYQIFIANLFVCFQSYCEQNQYLQDLIVTFLKDPHKFFLNVEFYE
ncbi:hypothetical protein TTHERM_000382149 (macronuclear) [Tetrahymena thermophila SB210]|uniref:Uncharacterized protein n=1 Tax=Tetrahymena thermophila (strain SB210) TaxID=312017 RepID=W7XD13_TETTS|nr:hypothetical protein TTHERM_000382149 [Tetrahymena thermophila SB210]EWS74493.1 hypothetical protein TTHERM_000382149 [Tetrahymena thermophila SB210]|eukprot:XP_012652978.1 hypothetical protein TTHERM_000382149 [Tetrahymena thermophila SB210]